MSGESHFWGQIRAAVAGKPEFHLTRVENAVSSGFPDVAGVSYGRSVWMELKSERLPARRDTPLRFATRPSQALWHRLHRRAGGRSVVAVKAVASSREGTWYLVDSSNYDKLDAIPIDGLESIAMHYGNCSLAQLEQMVVLAGDWCESKRLSL